jgi:hypothetical protein
MASRLALDLFDTDHGSRREPRYTLLLCVKLLTPRGLMPARLRDLSLSGAMIEGADLPPPGANLFLLRGHLEISARVAWRRGDQAGLEFHVPLSEAQLLAEVNPTCRLADTAPAATAHC